MNSLEITQATRAIGTMLAGFPSSQSAINAETVRAYMTGVEKFPSLAIESACVDFLSGAIARNHSFAPTAAELADRARMYETILDRPDDRPLEMAYRLGALPPPCFKAIGPLEVDFGEGMIDMRNMTWAEKEEVLRTKRGPSKRLGFSAGDRSVA